MHSFVARLAGCLTLLAPLGAVAQTNQIQNGSFEATALGADNYCYIGPACAIPGWSNSSAALLISSDSLAWGNPSGLGNWNSATYGGVVAGLQNQAALEQSVNLTAGSYVLSWSDAGRRSFSDQTYLVSLVSADHSSGTLLGSYATAPGQAWQSHALTVNVATTGSYALRLSGQQTADGTAFVDHFSLTSAVPEPNSAALLLTGLAGLAGLGSVRRRTSHLKDGV